MALRLAIEAVVYSLLYGASVFVREYTLASGGPYCDCGYKKRRA